MDWRLICIVLLLFIQKSEAGEKLLKKRNAQGNKCPYSAIDIASLIHSEGKHQRTFFDQLKDGIRDFIWGKEGSSLDHVPILSPDAVHSVEGCCPGSDLVCDTSYPYRSHDGSCNNLDHPSWGMSGECQLRLLPASYEGSDGLRVSVSGSPLPKPRDLSLGIFPLADRPTLALSAMFVFFGQFVAHDTMQTPTATRNNVPCCPYNDVNRARAECLPIFVRRDDPYYSRFNTTCLTFERTTVCSNTTGKVNKFNKETATLDLSMVYGTNEGLADTLRLKDGTGRLDFEKNSEQKELLPRNKDGISNFCSPFNPEECFLAGDDRDDMHATLTSYHTLFLREHNRLARKLKEINPHWKEETLYQEARKIFIAQWQNMVYSEYLPLALGPRHMSHFGLRVGGTGSRYNASARLGIWLAVSTAGFRLHSMVASETGLQDLRFYETYLNPSLIREGCAEHLLRGASRVPSQEFDRYLVEDVDGQFLRLPGLPVGLDTAAIDILRGRDNGLPTYVEIVYFLTGKRITTFDSLNDLMTPKNIQLLKENYESVEDVDLWVGLQLEEHMPGSVLGFNTATLTALQFHFLKYGDRFFFDHRGQKATSFTEAQLTSLRKSTLSRLLCDNMNLMFIQKRSLLLPSHKNPIVDCIEIPEVDLTPWKTEH